jgi:uncharacterized protein (TIGR02466 family)
MTKNNGIIVPVFPEAFLYFQLLNVNSSDVLKYVESLKFNPIEQSKQGAFTCFVSEKLNIFNDLTFLKEEIDKEIDHYLHNIFFYKMDYKITTSWATKTESKGYGQRHFHGNHFLSGVYYPVGNKNFAIKFYKKNVGMWQIQNSQFNEFNAKELTFPIVKDNTLILFPSNLDHSIESNEDVNSRYSVAFNVNPKGYIGENDSGIIF